MKWYIYEPWDAKTLEPNNIVGVLKIMAENLRDEYLHAMVALYGCHTSNFPCIP